MLYILIYEYMYIYLIIWLSYVCSCYFAMATLMLFQTQWSQTSVWPNLELAQTRLDSRAFVDVRLCVSMSLINHFLFLLLSSILKQRNNEAIHIEKHLIKMNNCGNGIIGLSLNTKYFFFNFILNDLIKMYV